MALTHYYNDLAPIAICNIAGCLYPAVFMWEGSDAQETAAMDQDENSGRRTKKNDKEEIRLTDKEGLTDEEGPAELSAGPMLLLY